MSSWTEAVKAYFAMYPEARGIPRKGTDGYDKVKELQMKHEKAMKKDKKEEKKEDKKEMKKKTKKNKK
jgi:hypothetical protein